MLTKKTKSVQLEFLKDTIFAFKQDTCLFTITVCILKQRVTQRHCFIVLCIASKRGQIRFWFGLFEFRWLGWRIEPN